MTQSDAYAFLQGLSSKVETARYPLEDDEIVIGRGTACQIHLDDPKVSRQHARIRFHEGVAIIEDLKSSHGTLVNGQRVLSAELQAGDELTLGDTRLRFEPTPDAVATIMVGEPGRMEAQTPERVATIACTNCGEQVATDKRFCPQCGQSLQSPVPKPTPAVHPAPSAPAVVPPPAPVQVSLPIAPPVVKGTSEEKGRRRWLPFLLGVGIPLVLAALGVLALVLLGVFDEPEALPEFEQQGQALVQPQSGDDTVDEPDLQVSPAVEGGENSQPSAISPFGFRTYNPETDQDLPGQSDLAEYLESGGEGQDYEYVIELSSGQDLVLDYFYCGKTESLLSDIADSIQISFKIDAVPIPQDSLYLDVLRRETRACNVFRGVLYNIAPGEYLLTQTMIVEEQIYDGWETWGPEELPMTTLIRMEGDMSPTGSENDTAVEVVPPGEPTVTLHEGDARAFAIPPAVIAYANTQERSAPAEIEIEEGCGEDCWRYFEWIGISKVGQWIEAYSAVPTTAIGVQFWGDANDGLARVWLDGEEVWSGDTRGEDNQWPGGAFVRYLEISGLPDGPHSLIVEALEGGRSVTLYFFGIGAVLP